jgi:hypothetical protein
VLYFLLPDRFSDNSERDYLDVNGKAVQTGTTRRFDRKADFENAIQTAADAQRWRDAGGVWVGGNLKGVTSKLGYLRRMGVTDRYIREAMFGGELGACRSRHFFDERNPIHIELAKICKIRQDNIALRRGRQYLREISGDGVNFGFPFLMGARMRSVVAWSRLFVEEEILLAVNTDPDQPSFVWVTIDNDLHQTGDNLTCIYCTDAAEIGKPASIQPRNGKAVRITVPLGAFAIYK